MRGFNIALLIIISQLCGVVAQKVNIRYKIGESTASIGEESEIVDCGVEHTRSLECSGNGGPDKCCPGLVCHEYQTWRCVTGKNMC